MTKDSKIRKKMKKLYPHLATMPLEMLVHKVISMDDDGMKGTGFYDKFVNKIVGLHNKAFGKKKDPRHRQLKDGEVHAILKNKKGALVPAQFSGPGTDLIGNTRDNLKKHGSIEKATKDDAYVDVVDRIAHQHDSKYYLNSGDEKAIREADIKFVLDHARELKKPGHSKWNIIPPMTGIMAKIGLENLGIMKKGAFSDGTDLSKERPEDVEMIRNVSKHLETQYGHGKYRPMRGNGIGGREVAHKHLKILFERHSIGTPTADQLLDAYRYLLSHYEAQSPSTEKNNTIFYVKRQIAKLRREIQLATDPLNIDDGVDRPKRDLDMSIPQTHGVTASRPSGLNSVSNLSSTVRSPAFGFPEPIFDISPNVPTDDALQEALDLFRYEPPGDFPALGDDVKGDDDEVARLTQSKVNPKSKKGGKPRKPNLWIEHIRATAKKHGIKYGEAISLASKTWKKKK